MRKEAEDAMQAKCVKWFNNKYCLKTNEDRAMIFSIPNGGSRDIREAMVMTSTGTLPGASDLVVILPVGNIFFIEMKLPKGVQSEVQKEFQQRVEKLGFKYYIIRTFESFQSTIEYEFNRSKK